MDLAMATALKLPPLSPRADVSPSAHDEELPTLRTEWGHRGTDVFLNSGRFQSVRTARAQGEVYIHEHDHGAVPRSDEHRFSPRELRGEVKGRSDAARRITEYRSRHAHPVREPQAEREPAVRLWMLSDEFRKQSPRRKRISPGTRAPFIGPLITSTAQVLHGM